MGLRKRSDKIIILHPYLKGVREEEQQETWQCLEEIRKYYLVIDKETTGDYGYDDFWKEHWGKEDFINIEMDNVVNKQIVDSLANCSGGYCSYMYPMYWDIKVIPCNAFGCVKISKQLQDLCPARLWYKSDLYKNTKWSYEKPWQNMDGRVKSALMTVCKGFRKIPANGDEDAGIAGGRCGHIHNTEQTMIKHNHYNADYDKILPRVKTIT